MKPAWSVVFFTTLAGAAQGLVVWVAAFVPADALRQAALLLATALAVAGLLASFFHLGRPERAWRAAAMWRTSWLSREVIVLPAFIAWTLGWWWLGRDTWWLAGGAVLLAALLWNCTAMIYAGLRFVQEWAHPLTPVNFVLIGLSSGALLAQALSVAMDLTDALAVTGWWALGTTLLAGVVRVIGWRRNDTLRPRSTLQSATGIAAPQLKQQAMGMTGGSFNTREFFHGRSAATLVRVRVAALALGFVLPALLAAWGCADGPATLWWLAWPLQYAGLLAERWLFFADARHPQNLYYQTAT